MSEKLRNGVLVDNRRPENRSNQRYYDFVFPSQFTNYRVTRGLEILNIPEQELQATDLVQIRAGDGTIGAVFNLFLSLNNRGIIEYTPVFLYEGGGSAMTLGRGLSLSKQAGIAIPDKYQDTLFPSLFEARAYHPLEVTDQQGKKQIQAYLAGFGHLTLETTLFKDRLTQKKIANRKNLHATYTAGGIASAVSLLARRIQPQKASFRDNGQTYPIEGEIGAFEVLTIPVLGTFYFKDPVADNKVRLLVVTANSPLGLLYKYAATLLIGGLTKGGPDKVIEMGLVDKHDVDQVMITPGIPRNLKRPNVCLDGEMVRRSGELTIGRSEQGVLFAFPRALGKELRRKP